MGSDAPFLPSARGFMVAGRANGAVGVQGPRPGAVVDLSDNAAHDGCLP